MELSILGILWAVIVIWVLIGVFKSSTPILGKLVWILVIVALPVLGVILWLIFGNKR